jgi:hypothetical protein
MPAVAHDSATGRSKTAGNVCAWLMRGATRKRGDRWTGSVPSEYVIVNDR